VPEDDRFMLVTQHDAEEFDYSPRYLGIARSDDLVVIQITVSNTRTVEKKQALYRRIVERLADNPGARPEDVFISLVEVLPEDWSFGHGRAQYVESAG
jgi:phenylpyruvate tautomerase PptA (4-oxalocrotonate tautomerase family)